MIASDFAGLVRSGATGRNAQLSFFDNLMFRSENWKSETPDDLIEWHNAAMAWAAGWVGADAGRDKGLTQLLRVRHW